MKKKLFFLAVMVAAVSANAQWFDFKNNVHRYEIGFNIGKTGIGTGFSDLGFGASVSAWGVYLDVITAGPMYKYDSRVASMNDPANVRYLPDSATTTINIGYQVPVLPWLRVMPLIGFTINSSGVTDMATHSAEVSGSEDNITVSLYHDYNRQERWNYLNYGGGIVLSPIKWVSIYGVYTMHSIYGGITFNLTPRIGLAED